MLIKARALSVIQTSWLELLLQTNQSTPTAATAISWVGLGPSHCVPSSLSIDQPVATDFDDGRVENGETTEFLSDIKQDRGSSGCSSGLVLNGSVRDRWNR